MATKKAAPEKKVRKVLTDEEKEARRNAQKEKYSTPQDQYVTINESKVGKDLIITQALQVRGEGVHLRTISPNGISSEFVPFVKLKKKSAWILLVADKSKDTEEEA